MTRSADAMISCRRLTPSTGSPETLSLASHWIQECTTTHQRCQNTTAQDIWYPTRLLSFDVEGSAVAKLIETAQARPTTKYMTLTHRWGITEHLKLTKETYSFLTQDFPLSYLPRLFQDAVFICRHLRIKYLWIDCLCIFQGKDGLQDWEHEASLMGDVYAHSFCNISAADALDCSQSIFNKRDHYTIIPEVVQLDRGIVGSRITQERFTVSNYNFWETEVSNALVNKRAWVLQERCLAPRILHFGKRQLFWECCERDAAEIYPNGLPLALSTSPHAKFKQLDPSAYLDRVLVHKYRKADGNSVPHLLWHRIVEQYTASALTFSSDKLIACCGVAKRIAEIVQDEYIVGMWRRYLEGELLWVVQHGRGSEPYTRPEKYRAPTWSWASVDGPVQPGEPRTQDSLIKVEDYHLDYCTSDKTGAVSGGWLRLRGVLKRAVFKHKGKSVRDIDQWGLMLDIRQDESSKTLPLETTDPVVKLDVPHEVSQGESSNGAFYYMCARLMDKAERNMYLLLLKLVDEESGTFRRIGVAYASNTEVKAAALRRSPAEASLPCIRYQDGLHSIHII